LNQQTIEEQLLKRYGVLMRLDDLAQMLGSDPRRVLNGFANRLPWCLPFRRAQIKFGRRVYFNTITVAEVLNESQHATAIVSQEAPVDVQKSQRPSKRKSHRRAAHEAIAM